MEVEVTFLTRRGSAVMRRSRQIEARRIRLGRGTGNEIQLPDIRVDLAAAALFPRNGILTIEALGPSPVRVNGRGALSVPVGPGDEIMIGPYRIRLVEPATGQDAALFIELVQPLGDALGRLMSQARIGLSGAAFDKRRASWAGFLLAIVLCLVVPIIAYSIGLIPTSRPVAHAPGPAAAIAAFWEPGTLSNAHRFFAADCATCHRAAFARVPDDACLGCHEKVGGHAAPGPDAGNLRHRLATMRCTSCHQEHRGSRMVVSDARLCRDCHFAPAPDGLPLSMRDIPGFSSAHPQFRVTLVADAAGPRLHEVELGTTPPPEDRPGIKFSHAAHLVPGGFPALGYKPLVCADCHTPDAAGEGFLPITYKQQCERCHALTFEPRSLPWPNGAVPHGEGTGIAAAVWNYYAGKVLQGAVVEAEAPAVLRRAPGLSSANPAAPQDATPRSWVAAKTEAALRTVVFDPKRGCAYCHYGTGPNGAFELSGMLPTAAGPPRKPPGPIVAPVALRTRFLPFARFSHARHTALDCQHCHAASRAKTAGTVMIPGKETCLTCHGPEKAASRVESTCITCHRFHHSGLGPMRALEAAAR